MDVYLLVQARVCKIQACDIPQLKRPRQNARFPPPPPRSKNNAEHASRIAPIETSRPALPPPPGATSWALLPALCGWRRCLAAQKKKPTTTDGGRVTPS